MARPGQQPAPSVRYERYKEKVYQPKIKTRDAGAKLGSESNLATVEVPEEEGRGGSDPVHITSGAVWDIRK